MRRSSVAFAILMASAAIAFAEPAPRKPIAKTALEHNAQAAKLFATQSFELAVAEYKASALIEPAPVTDLNLGQCYRILGERADDPAVRKRNYERALWHYERFVKSSPETPLLAEQVGAVMSTLRDDLAKMAPADPPPSSPTQPIESPRVQSVDRPPPSPSHWYQDGVGWGLAGAGAVSAGVAAGLFLSASSLRGDASRTPNQQEQNALNDKADTRSLLGTTLAIVGGGLLVSGVIKLAIHSDRLADHDHELANWNVGVSPTGFVVFGAF